MDKSILSSRVSLIALLVVGLLGVMEAQAQDRSRFLRWAYDDARGLARESVQRLPIALAAGAVLVLPARDLDNSTLEQVQDGYDGLWGDYLDVTNEMGGPMMWGPVTSVFAVSLLTNDSKFQDAAFTSLESFAYAGAITAGLKELFGRARPEKGLGPITFRPFSGDLSLPSGHTTTAFAIVTPWVLYYPGPFTYGLFALSTGTAVARVARDKHWPTDVLAGATIGILTARWLTRRHQRGHAAGGGIEIYPAVSAGSVSLLVRVKIG